VLPATVNSITEENVVVPVDTPDLAVVGDGDVLERTANFTPGNSSEFLGSELSDVGDSASVSEDSSVVSHSTGMSAASGRGLSSCERERVFWQRELWLCGHGLF